jgi:hypothetical protein
MMMTMTMMMMMMIIIIIIIAGKFGLPEKRTGPPCI